MDIGYIMFCCGYLSQTFARACSSFGRLSSVQVVWQWSCPLWCHPLAKDLPWVDSCTKGWLETHLKRVKRVMFLQSVLRTNRSRVHYSIVFRWGLLIICLWFTSFTGFEELQSACASTGTGAIAIWWRPGSWAAKSALSNQHVAPSKVSSDIRSKQDRQCQWSRWEKENVELTWTYRTIHEM